LDWSVPARARLSELLHVGRLAALDERGILALGSPMIGHQFGLGLSPDALFSAKIVSIK